MQRDIWKYRLISLLVMGLFITTASSIAGQSSVASYPDKQATETGYLTRNGNIMNNMMSDMTIKRSGNVDQDFVELMEPHHQGAIAMAQSELAFGHNEQLSRIAQEIVVEQIQEIAAMRLAIKEPASPTWVEQPTSNSAKKSASPHTSSATETSYLAQNNHVIAIMMTGMAVPQTGDVSHDFVAMMVPHHLGAIRMAELELQYGKNASLKRVAREIIVDQGQEIAMMKIALSEPIAP
jgi:uncharacterized protein (DUF305 family)